MFNKGNKLRLECMHERGDGNMMSCLALELVPDEQLRKHSIWCE